MGIDELAQRLLETKRRCVFLGDGVFVYKEYLKEALLENAFFAEANNNMQRASSVAVAACLEEKNKK